jgi:hypothetical protein
MTKPGKVRDDCEACFDNTSPRLGGLFPSSLQDGFMDIGIVPFQSGQREGTSAAPQLLPKHQWQVDPVYHGMRNCDRYTSAIVVITRIRGGKSLYANCCEGDGTTSVCYGASTALYTIRDCHITSRRSGSRSDHCDTVMDGYRLTESGWIGQVGCDDSGGIEFIHSMSRCRSGDTAVEIRIARIAGRQGFYARCVKSNGTDDAGTTLCAIRDYHTACGTSTSRSNHGNAVIDRDRLTDQGWIGRVRCDGRRGIGFIDRMSCRCGGTAVEIRIARIRGSKGFCACCCKGDGTSSCCDGTSTIIDAIRDGHIASGRSSSRSDYGNAVIDRDRLTDHGWIGRVRCDGRRCSGFIDNMSRCRSGATAAEIRIASIRGRKRLITSCRKSDGTSSRCNGADAALRAVRDGYIS